ncbi:MAG: hypothetical protein HKL90_03120 [Elusimicrobia bacterium]|nr:hypothetical protein [Elusimicrobiota bacterium]
MRYWAYINGEVPGSFSPEQLAAVPGVSNATLVCPAEGEIDEKSWRRAGEFDEVARALAERDAAPAAAPSPAPAAAAAASTAVSATSDVDSMLDSSSAKLFNHVADLMKELEMRREEKALVLSLQRQMTALKDELAQSRDRSAMLELRLLKIGELEETARKDQAVIQSLQSNLQAREKAHEEARQSLDRMKNELEATRRRQFEANTDLSVRNRLVDKLSKDLSDKELALAKALNVIRRLEEDLHRLCPGLAAAPPVVTEPLASPPEAAPMTELSVPAAPKPPAPSAPLPTVTADEPAPAPAYLEPPHAVEGSKPQLALAALLKRFFPGQPH